MKKFYEKNEIWFAVIWIIVYVVGASLADTFSSMIGIEKVITLPFLFALSAFFVIWIVKNNLKDKYGLCKPIGDIKNYLFYLPLLVLISVNFWMGAKLNYSPLESVLFALSMVLVGFVEEIIFRGLLFKAIAKENVKVAIIVSSVTFGIGHIINLISSGGENILSHLLQVFYAMAVGFLFVVMFYRGKSLVACIVTHSLVNAGSTFQNAVMPAYVEIIQAVVIIVVAVVYAVVLWRTLPKQEDNLVENK